MPTAFPPYTAVQELVSPLGVVLAATTQQLSQVMVQWKQVPSFCQPVVTTYCLCSCSPVSHPPAAGFQSVLCPFLSTIMHLRILKGASSPIVPQVSELAHMAVPCAPCITISAASQDTQILSPLLVTHSDIQEQPLQLKKIKFPAL